MLHHRTTNPAERAAHIAEREAFATTEIEDFFPTLERCYEESLREITEASGIPQGYLTPTDQGELI
jgi:hypothetical protein